MSSKIIDEQYEAGVPGRACLSCNSAWPASEPDDASWHHANGCSLGEERRREIAEEIGDEERHEREVEWNEGPLWI